MLRELQPKSLLVLILSVLALPVIIAVYAPENVSAQTADTPGALTAVDGKGKLKAVCPLKHTDVKAEISGFISRVVVTQHFENPFPEKIEAVYTFPLPQNAAVDDMTMIVGNRTVRGKILPREQAQAVYAAAKEDGQVASLLDQERPNIFTQSVANILPGEQVKITISYVETLSYVNGAYEFVFPMVVGPRYIPGAAKPESQGTGFAPDTTQVPDASRITPRAAPAGVRSGHDISLEVALDAGLIIDNIDSKTHPTDIQRPDAHSARLRLKNEETIPNKDFILRYDVAGQAIQDALLTHRSEKGGFFTVIMQPPDRVTAQDVTPKELVFVLDTSGSMSGFPIEKAKETIKLALDGLYPSDTFNLITFAGDTRILFPQPVPATPANLGKAEAFLNASAGFGGTEMMKAIKAALEPSDDQSYVRIVCFMTDGYVGNDMEIISEVQKHPNARVFSFGIGSSVNRFLLDKMAEAGRGEVEYVDLKDDGSAAARRFHERVRDPLLTDISIEWNNLPVADVYPQRIPDLFSAKPLVIKGRYTAAGRGTIRLKGKMAGVDYVRDIAVEFPETMASHDVLAPLWARARIDDLMGQDFNGAQSGTMRADLKKTITQLGIEYRLMTQFTSFVAVEERVVTDRGKPRRIDVPVEVPKGVQRAMVQENALPQGTPINVQANGGYLISGSATPQSLNGFVLLGGGSGSRKARVAPPPNNAPTISSVTANIGADIDPGAPIVPPVPQSNELEEKLHRAVFAIVQKLKNKQALSADENGLIRDGKAEVQVWLTEKTDETMAQLKELGFEVVSDAKNAKIVIGRLPVEKLEALARFKFVKYVAPQR
ncbi:MAG TPA: VIT and VWA domain-containing protein [Pyrinomonadaceae bacterium]|nr:VIT and VWA domain-containing protein [Pyrinomonadaceae bacterium]